MAGEMELRGIADIGIKGFIYLAFFYLLCLEFLVKLNSQNK